MFFIHLSFFVVIMEYISRDSRRFLGGILWHTVITIWNFARIGLTSTEGFSFLVLNFYLSVTVWIGWFGLRKHILDPCPATIFCGFVGEKLICLIWLHLLFAWYIVFWISLQITDLPFSLYSTFVIEARHGFNKVCILSENCLPCSITLFSSPGIFVLNCCSCFEVSL